MSEPRLSHLLPAPMRTAVAWSVGFLVVAAAAAVAVTLIVWLHKITVPVMVAIVLSALLVPLSRWLQRHGWPKWAAVTVAELGAIAVAAGLITLAVWQIRAGLPRVLQALSERVDQFTAWLHGAPFNLTDTDLSGLIAQIETAVQLNMQALLSGVLTAGSTIGSVLAGLLLVLFTTLFIMLDGPRMFRWFTSLFPRRARAAAHDAGRAGWRTLSSFVRVQILVAFVDAVGIGAGAMILGLFFDGFPFVIPIMITVFLGSFIPVLGAILSGALAVAVALVFLGPVPAIIMLAIVIAVQQIEGHVLQPLVMSAAVRIHPLAVVLAVAAGGFLAGIPGAFFAVPAVAVINIVTRTIAARRTSAPATPPLPTMRAAAASAD